MGATAAGQPLFVYGTLLFAPVMRLVAGKDYPTTPASLSGYQRWCVRGARYPGVIECAQRASSVPGALCLGLDEDALQRLDAYEDSFYERRRVSVTTSVDGSLEALCYVVPREHHHRLERRPWNPGEFERRHLASFVRGLAGEFGSFDPNAG